MSSLKECARLETFNQILTEFLVNIAISCVCSITNNIVVKIHVFYQLCVNNRVPNRPTKF